MSGQNEASKKVIKKEEIERRIRELIIEVHNLEIELESLPDNISELDSVQTIALVVKLEEEFGIMFDNDELLVENFETVSKIVEQITNKLGDE